MISVESNPHLLVIFYCYLVNNCWLSRVSIVAMNLTETMENNRYPSLMIWRHFPVHLMAPGGLHETIALLQ